MESQKKKNKDLKTLFDKFEEKNNARLKANKKKLQKLKEKNK